MKTKFKCGIVAVVVMVAGFIAYQTYGSYGAQDNSLLMQNIEALAQSADAGESGDPTGEGGSVVKCKHSYEAPNQKISVVAHSLSHVICYKKGSVYVKKTEESSDSLVINGDYEKYKEYDVMFYIKDCVENTGSCCDQRKVGAYKVG